MNFIVVPPVDGPPCIKASSMVHQYHTFLSVFLVVIILLHISISEHPLCALCAVVAIVFVDILLVWHDRQYAWIERSQEPQKIIHNDDKNFIFDDREHAAKEAFAARIEGRDDIVTETRLFDMGDIII